MTFLYYFSSTRKKKSQKKESLIVNDVNNGTNKHTANFSR